MNICGSQARAQRARRAVDAFEPPTQEQILETRNSIVQPLRRLVSPVFFSTRPDGTVERGLGAARRAASFLVSLELVDTFPFFEFLNTASGCVSLRVCLERDCVSLCVCLSLSRESRSNALAGLRGSIFHQRDSSIVARA